MSKLEGYTGSIDLISGIRQKNNGSFPLAEANAIQTRDDGTRLDEELELLKSNIGASAVYNTTIGTEWDGEVAPYTQDIAIDNIKEENIPIVDVVLDPDYNTSINQLNDFGKIYRITTSDGFITVYASEKTSIEIPIQLKV